MKSPKPIFRGPSATYRLQFNRGFNFSDGRKLIPYLHELGISDCYCSPIFTAPAESNHGYDVCDLTRINPVLGSTEDWNALSAELQRNDMGLLLDFVPNHMGTIAGLNKWWTDVLEYGPRSPYATFFDIDWNSPRLPDKGKVILSILPDHYDRVLKQGGIRLIYEEGRFALAVGETKLPVHASTCRRLLEVAHSTTRQAAIEQVLQSYNQPADGFAALHSLIEEQSYRLTYWHSGTRMVNYRRFFDVDSLIALRMEKPEVFEATHELLLNLIQKGQVTGLRLDHIDGLADPQGYLCRLQSAIAKKCGVPLAEDGKVFLVLVEKITMEGESLPERWPVSGTTGYEFAREVTRLLLDPEGERLITKTYLDYTGKTDVIEDSIRMAKKTVMTLGMSNELDGLAGLLYQCAQGHLETRDLLCDDLRAVLRETIACLEVYRTYRIAGQAATPQDKQIVTRAIAAAREANAQLEPLAFEFLQQLLLNEPALRPAVNEVEQRFVCRFQQTTGAIMAKGVEDTIFYSYNRLNALNEVGGNPAVFGMPKEEFHRLNVDRLKHWPNTMLTTSTHDTKVSEDVRARLAVISEMPAEWTAFLESAAVINAQLKVRVAGCLAPDANEEYLLYQILCGTWPLQPFASGEQQEYLSRIQAYMTKALNEAKVNTRWDRRNKEWEQATMNFIERIIVSPSPEFERLFAGFSTEIAKLGAVNSLSQLLLKMTVPGVPDFYQGNELWQYILVDPDNRRQIDFDLRQKMMQDIKSKSPTDLLAEWQNGAIKMFLTKTTLNFRRKQPQLFSEGEYVPLEVRGTLNECCLAFARTFRQEKLVVLVPRFTRKVGFMPLGEKWKDTCVDASSVGAGKLRDLFTGREITSNQIPLSEAFAELPFAALIVQAS